MNPGKPFGWEVIVNVLPTPDQPKPAVKRFHYRGCTERQARIKALVHKNVTSIVSITPVFSQEEWERAYGIPQRM